MVSKHPRLVSWWQDAPGDPGRLTLTDPDVQALVRLLAPDGQVADLGGTMSLNLHLRCHHRVLRVHQPFVSRTRLLGLYTLRRELCSLGLAVAKPVELDGALTLRLRNRSVECEKYVPHDRHPHMVEAYLWLFDAMGIEGYRRLR
jgi:hypothetical protein